MTHLLLEYDESVDADYLQVSDAPWDRQERLDDARGVNFAADGSVVGIELLSPARIGVNLDGLPSLTMLSESCGRGDSGYFSEPPDGRH